MGAPPTSTSGAEPKPREPAHAQTKATCPPSENKELGPLATSVLPRIFKMYDLSGRAPDYEVYHPTATFEDPLMRAEGVKQIKSAFYSMVKLFQEAGIKEYSVTEAQTGEGQGKVVVDNVQHYKVFGKDIDVVSQIHLTVEDGRVISHLDLWNKKPLPTGAFGWASQGLRKANMMTTHALMGFGKDLEEKK